MSLLEAVAKTLLLYACFSLLFMLAVLFNLIINAIFKSKIKTWHEYLCNLLAVILSIVFGVLVFKFAPLKIFILICEITIVGSTLLYTNSAVFSKIFKNNREVGKTLYKNKALFFINFIIWLTYLITEIVLQLHYLSLITINDIDILYVYKSNEGSIIIVLATEILIKNIFNYIKIKKEK